MKNEIKEVHLVSPSIREKTQLLRQAQHTGNSNIKLIVAEGRQQTTKIRSVLDKLQIEAGLG